MKTHQGTYWLDKHAFLFSGVTCAAQLMRFGSYDVCTWQETSVWASEHVEKETNAVFSRAALWCMEILETQQESHSCPDSTRTQGCMALGPATPCPPGQPCDQGWGREGLWWEMRPFIRLIIIAEQNSKLSSTRASNQVWNKSSKLQAKNSLETIILTSN